MRKAAFFLLFFIILNQASALMVSPARISEERSLAVTNNLKETASYTVESECAKISEQEFELEPAERREVMVTPSCGGYVQVSEETETAINRFNIPVEHKASSEKEKKSLLVPFIVLCIAALALILIGGKLIKKGGTVTASII